MITDTSKRDIDGVCRFCAKPDRNRILHETDHFYIMLSLGPLVEGHLLIISNDHIECCADFGDTLAQEFEKLTERVKSTLLREYGTVLLFEHGRNASCLSLPHEGQHCFHAHMHCVPTEVDLSSLVETEIHLKTLPTWEAFRKIYSSNPKDYLYIENGNRTSISFVTKPLRHQYLRYKLAVALGEEEIADWHKVPGWGNIMKAKERLLPYF